MISSTCEDLFYDTEQRPKKHLSLGKSEGSKDPLAGSHLTNC